MKHSKVPCIKVSGSHQIQITTTELDQISANEKLVKITRGGICGSDIHYYQEGGIGNFSLKTPYDFRS